MTGPKTIMWIVIPQRRPRKVMCHILPINGELWADPNTGEPPWLVGHSAFHTREEAVARTQELVKHEMADLRKRLAKLDRLEIA
jgi:hypothetical protein